MKITIKTVLFLSTIFLFNCSSKKSQILQIDGKTVGTDTKSFILVKPNQDARFDSIIEIPVIDGRFHYESKLEHPEAVTLFLTKDLGRFMSLFLENEKIDLTIYPEEEFDKNIVKGGNLNYEYKRYKNALDSKYKSRSQPLHDSLISLLKNDQYYSDEMKEVLSELKNAKSQDEKIVIRRKRDLLREEGLDKTTIARELDEKGKILYEEMKEFEQKYIEDNPTLVSYSFLLSDLEFNKETIDIDLAKRNYKNLSKAYPNHPYNKLASNLINAIENVRIGKKYTDFSAPDLNGNNIKLSNKIKGKVALLDLWATWCGSCIAKSRTMVPIYNEYKDKGFTIVGVAGEFKSTNRLVKILEKEKWAWLNLVELDRQNNIWQKYGVDGGGGGMFLIDENGLILAKNPTAEEVRKELEIRLN